MLIISAYRENDFVFAKSPHAMCTSCTIPVISTRISCATKIDRPEMYICLSRQFGWHVMLALSRFFNCLCKESLLFYDNMDLLVHETNSY